VSTWGWGGKELKLPAGTIVGYEGKRGLWATQGDSGRKASSLDLGLVSSLGHRCSQELPAIRMQDVYSFTKVTEILLI
jgi:hypothetical protein